MAKKRSNNRSGKTPKSTTEKVDQAVKGVKTAIKVAKSGAPTAIVAEGISAAGKVARDAIKSKQEGKKFNLITSIGKAVKNVPILGSAYKAGRLLGDLINDREWYEKYGKLTPARNINRPMNPIYSTDISTEPTAGAVPKHVDINIEWDALIDSTAFNTISFKVMEKIRTSMKSNLPYTLNKVKCFLQNSIAIAIFMAQVQRQLAGQKVAPEHDPQFNRLWNKVAPSSANVGIQNLQVLQNYTEDNLASTIALYDVVCDIAGQVIILPEDLAKFIDHYFVNVFADNTDGHNAQYYKLRLNVIKLANYTASTDSYEIVDYNISELNPEELKYLVSSYMSQYSIVYSDIVKAGIYNQVNFPKYDQLLLSPVYSKTFIQAVVNGYTTNVFIDNDGVKSNYVRLDEMECEDPYTQFLFMGGLQNTSSGNAIASPLIRVVSQSIKVMNDSTLTWPLGLQNNKNIIIPNEDFAITVTSLIDSSTKVVFNEATGEYVDYANPGSITISDSGITKLNSYKIKVTSGGAGSYTTAKAVQRKFIYIPIGYTWNTGYHRWYYMRFERTNKNSIGYATLDTEHLYVRGLQGEDGRMTSILAYDEDFISDQQWVIYDSISKTWVPTQPVTFDQIACTFTGKLPTVYTTQLQNYDPGFITFTSYNDTSILIGSVEEEVTTAGIFAIQWNYVSSYIGASAFGLNYFSFDVEGNAGLSESVQSQFALLAGYFCEIVDHHIPIECKSSIDISLEDQNPVTINLGSTLLKEAFMPYWYNIDDLVPLSYNMILSLLS